MKKYLSLSLLAATLFVSPVIEAKKADKTKKEEQSFADMALDAAQKTRNVAFELASKTKDTTFEFAGIAKDSTVEFAGIAKKHIAATSEKALEAAQKGYAKAREAIEEQCKTTEGKVVLGAGVAATAAASAALYKLSKGASLPSISMPPLFKKKEPTFGEKVGQVIDSHPASIAFASGVLLSLFFSRL